MRLTETERLELLPLDVRLLRLWAEDLPALEQELSCSYQAEPMEGCFLEIVKGQLAATERDPDHYMWHSFWLLLRKMDRVVVGAADFKNVPDENGEVEIGYGLGTPFEGSGYMTEAVKAMCAWAEQQEGVRHVIAETERDSLPSQRVLERCGFRKYDEASTIWWRRQESPHEASGILVPLKMND
ncbi:MAG: GNAT family N-acetyltransferase [Oscillospiraceae bacterium]|nr:GNAT family N-acetyltransferase [Oscillospiraceae bacterium]